MNAEIQYDTNIMLVNNEWGFRDATSNSWQCIELFDNPKAAQIVYDWIPLNDSLKYNVKCYPGLRIQDPNYGLPFQLSLNKSIITSWSTTHTNTSSVDWYDNAWDIWINNAENKNSDRNHSAEIMIWLAYSPELTINSNTRIKQDLSFWNLKFDLYKDKWGSNKWWTYSFLTTSQNGFVWNVENVDVNEMLYYLVKENYLPEDDYIWAINIGVEIRQGKGQFTYQYQVDIN